MSEKKDKDKYMLEGVVAYVNHLTGEIRQGRLKTVEEICGKLSKDGEIASGALSCHFREELKLAGWTTGLIKEEEEKKDV